MLNFSPDLLCFLPEIFFGVSSCVLLFFYSFFSTVIVSSFKKTVVLSNLAYWLTSQLFIYTFLLIINNPIKKITLFYGLLIFDSASYFAKLFLVFSFFVVLTVAKIYFDILELVTFEFFVLILLSFFGLLVIVQANDLLTFYLALELQSLGFYSLTSYKRDSSFSVEAGMKYFILGALASGIFLFGCSLLYGTTGTTHFSVFALLFSVDFQTTISYLSILGLFFVLVGFLFKLTAAPFHVWASDTYEGAPVFISFFFAVVPKIAFILVLSRIVYSCFYSWLFFWANLFLFSSFFSLFLGAFGALSQRKIKRFLVFSSITHVGYFLLGLSTGSVYGLSSVFFYLIIYVIMVFGLWSLFFCFFIKKTNKISTVKYLEDFRFLFRENPSIVFLLLILLFSLAGIPPFAGFYSKLYVFFCS